jgi:hypothetical protein
MFENPRQVVVRLTGHIDLICPEDALGELPALSLIASGCFVVNPQP